MSKLFKRTLLLMVALFGIIATGTSIVSAWNLYHELTQEYQSKGTAIAKSIADSSVEVLLNRDASTVQAIVDQFTEIEGVSYVLVTDRSGDIVSHTFVPGVPKEVLKIQSAGRNGRKGLTTTYLDIDGIEGGVIDISAPILAGVAGYAHVGMDRTLIRAQIWKAVMEQQGLMLLIFLASVLIAYALINRISQPLNLLAGHARSLAAADFSAGVTVPPEIDALSNRTTDEIGNLARSFASMERALDQSIKHLKETTAAKERIESELKIAHDIQMSMVPKIFPPFPDRHEFDLYATLVPAKEVGGDLYDFFFIDKDHLCFVIGDVSGKGVPASLFMAVTKTLFKATTAGSRKPGEILFRLNEDMCRDNTSGMFVTLFAAILNIRTGQMQYSNGGHNLPYLLSNGRLRPLENTEGMIVGAFEGVPYHQKEITLQPGDTVFLYTDGVTEAQDTGNNLFTERRLEEFLVSTNDNASPQELTAGLIDEVKRFSAGTAQSDDITVLVLRYRGAQDHATGQITIELKNERAEVARLNQTLTDFGQRHRLSAKVLADMNLALSELVTNVISYGFDDAKEHRIKVGLFVERGELRAEIEDDGKPFNPLEMPPPDTRQALEKRSVGGLGVHLVRTLMDEVTYQRREDGNFVVVKTRMSES